MDIVKTIINSNENIKNNIETYHNSEYLNINYLNYKIHIHSINYIFTINKSLKHLIINNIDLSDIINNHTILPENLLTLDLIFTCIYELPELPKKIISIICSFNKLKYLPELPNTIQYINCSYNNLKELPKLKNTNLININCKNNLELKIIPELPNTLKLLNCINCSIYELPYINDNMGFLSCNNNNIHRIKNYPVKLFYNFSNYCLNNPICNLFDINKKNIDKFNKFIYFFYLNKFKKKFKKILWEKIREPKIREIYSPEKLKILLKDSSIQKCHNIIDKWCDINEN
jgi:hypothetical protein